MILLIPVLGENEIRDIRGWDEYKLKKIMT